MIMKKKGGLVVLFFVFLLSGVFDLCAQSPDSLWFTDLKKMGINNGDEFVITLDEDRMSGPIILDFKNREVTIILRSINDLKNLSLVGTGALFTVDKGVTLVLENIALTGITGNNSALITIKNGGALVMNSGAIISGNINNNSDGQGGGVYIEEGNFFMNDGEISNNFAKFGGGVRQKIDGEFTMSGGTIKNNTGKNAGGGVYLNGSNFKFTGGSIEGNSAHLGGGVLIHGGEFNMRGGSIGGNNARIDGGGLFVSRGTFEKTGGIIYGADEDDVLLRNIAGNKGHAVFTSDLIRDTTAGIDIDLKSYTYSIF
jgi:hypothetical protein